RREPGPLRVVGVVEKRANAAPLKRLTQDALKRIGEEKHQHEECRKRQREGPQSSVISVRQRPTALVQSSIHLSRFSVISASLIAAGCTETREKATKASGTL